MSETSALERDPILVLADVGRLMRTLADQKARTHGMTRAQWVILVRLEQMPGLTQNEMASLLEVEPITIARLVDRLETRGLVERRSDPSDRRVWRLHLMKDAKPILKEINEAKKNLVGIITAGLAKADVERATDVLLHMKSNLCAQLRDNEKEV